MKDVYRSHVLKFVLLCSIISLLMLAGGCGDDDDSIFVVVDDGDAGFVKTGAAAVWNQGIGYKGDAYWKATSIDLARNSARWTPDLTKAGDYTVRVYVSREHSTTTNAQYDILASGQQTTVALNQSLFSDEWVELGSFSFSADGTEYVELTDFTGENGMEIVFDAVQWEK